MRALLSLCLPTCDHAACPAGTAVISPAPPSSLMAFADMHPMIIRATGLAPEGSMSTGLPTGNMGWESATSDRLGPTQHYTREQMLSAHTTCTL